MKSITNLLVAIGVLLSLTACGAQIKNSKTEIVKIYGNCGMCKEKIETAGSIKKEAKVVWEPTTKLATITYDSLKTNLSEILKRIALVGYDSDEFLAPDDVYSSLHGCCQYERANKTEAVVEEVKHDEHDHMTENNDSNEEEIPMDKEPEVKTGQLSKMYSLYFDLKNSLVASSSTKASQMAKEMLNDLDNIQMSEMPMDEHMVWMKEMTDLKKTLLKLQDSKSLEAQRTTFMALSASMYKLMKASQMNEPVYYQFCPMANDGKGANWLSQEKEIKNPYYGSQMLSCGKTVETLKK